MRVLAIGDIHGCSVALDTLLQSVAVQPGDTIVTLGDYVDRGPDSSGVINRLIALCQRHHVVALRGNHEQMMLQARDGGEARRNWRSNGGDTSEASYDGLDAVPEGHWRFIEEQCLDYWESETHFFVHASAYPNVPLFEQPPYVLYWGSLDKARRHESGKVMVCGHASQKNGLPLNLGYAVCIDTWAYGSGWLSCLDVASGQVWQANQAGQLRQFWLKDL